MIIKIEKSSNSKIGICEQCEELKPVRKIESIGLMGETRGWYQICYDCFKPRIFWKMNGRSGGMIYKTPIRSQLS